MKYKLVVGGIVQSEHETFDAAFAAFQVAFADKNSSLVALEVLTPKEGEDRPRLMVDSASDNRTVNNGARHGYRVLTADERSAMVAIKDAGLALIQEIEKLPPCRESSLGITKAEEAVMWAVKGVTK